MKKLILFLLILNPMCKILAQGLLETRAPAHYQQNQTDLNLGIGFINYYSQYTSRVPTFTFTYERAVSDQISAGGFLAYSAYTSNIDKRFVSNHAILGARAAYHLQFVENFDTYGGVALGLRFRLNNYIPPAYNPLSRVGGIGAVFVGSRYHFTENLGMYGEISLGIAFLNIGLTYKIL